MPLKLKIAENNSCLISLSGRINIMAIINGPQSPIIPRMLPQKTAVGFSHNEEWEMPAQMNQRVQGTITATP
jgi:hypothetical protein